MAPPVSVNGATTPLSDEAGMGMNTFYRKGSLLPPPGGETSSSGRWDRFLEA